MIHCNRLAVTLAVSQFLFLTAATLHAADVPQITLVVADNAPPLEKLAAEQLSQQFQKLWQAKVQISAKSQPANGAEILIGSPATNPAVKEIVGNKWPTKLTDQGIVLKSVLVNSATKQSGTKLIVGGGSPVATLWAASELGHQFGIRYHLAGDAYPAEAPGFRLTGFALVQEPNLRARTWRTINDFPIGPEAFGLAEHQRMLQQLAKQKFNRVLLSIYPWQPFMHYEFKGVKKQTAMLWFGYRYPIDGDTAGRPIFKGAKEFYNPDLAGKESYAELTKAAHDLMQGIIDESHRLGMTVGVSFSPLEFPKEFAEVLPGAKTITQLEKLTIGPGDKQTPDDKLLRELATAQLRSFLDAYPTLDAVYLTLPEHPEWEEHAAASWEKLAKRAGVSVKLADLEDAARNRHTIASGDRGVRAVRGNITSLEFLNGWLADPKLLETKKGKQAELYIMDVDPALYPYLEKLLPVGAGSINFIDYTARRVAEQTELLKTLPVGESAKRKRPSGDPSLIFTLADDNVGVLPQLATHHVATLSQALRDAKWAGFSTRYWIAGDLDPTVHFLSRSSFDASITPKQAYEDLVLPSCGDGVAERLIIGWDAIEQATDLLDKNDLGFAFPVPEMMMKHYAQTEPEPAWMQQLSDHYLNAMNEMYRAHDRSNPAGRKLLYNFARRYEFALEYVTAVQALRAAGVARAKGDAEMQTAKLEAAAESLYNGLTALSTVAKDDSGYQGVIAVLTEYGFRPIQKEIERLQDTAE